MNGPILSKVTIAPYEYEIRFTEELKNDGGTDLYGQIDYAKNVIRVREEYKDSQRLPFILWHEFLHGIIEAAGIDSNNDGEAKVEDIIKVLTPGIVQLLRDNRWTGEL